MVFKMRLSHKATVISTAVIPGETPLSSDAMVRSPTDEKSDAGHTDSSTLQTSPAKSPRKQSLVSPSPGPAGLPQIDQRRVYELRQTLDVDKLLKGTGEELSDISIITQGSTVSENSRTVISRVRVGGLLFAQKTFKSWAHPNLNQEQYNIYLREVDILKQLTRNPHWHVILLLRHYTDLKGQGCLLLSPLAQMTLETFLSRRPSQERIMLVRRWIGCLACGLAHLHYNKIKHKDIKPSNILIHGANPVIADMGISNRFDNDSKSSGPSAGTRSYEAPEALDGEIRGRRQDVWSLLCCYIEMLAFMKGTDCATFHKSKRLGHTSYYSIHSSIVDWLNSMKPAAADEDELTFIQLLVDSFKTKPEERPYVRGLAEQIRAIGEQGRHKYVGKCCVGDDTVNDSSILTVSQSTWSRPEDFENGSLLSFIASTARSLDEDATLTAPSSLASLYRQVSKGQIRSIRSAEQEFLLLIAPVRLLLSIPVQSCLLTSHLETCERWQSLFVSLQSLR
jgi:serine/threonine protein kinase